MCVRETQRKKAVKKKRINISVHCRTLEKLPRFKVLSYQWASRMNFGGSQWSTSSLTLEEWSIFRARVKKQQVKEQIVIVVT